MADETEVQAGQAAEQPPEAPAEAQEAAEAAATQSETQPAPQADVFDQMRHMVKGVKGEIARHPSGAKAIGIARGLAAEVEKNPLAAKAIGAVKETAEAAEKGELGSHLRRSVSNAAAEAENCPLVDLAHKVLLAGIGAAALATDEMEAFVNRLIERGEIAEADGRRVLQDVTEKRRKLMGESGLAQARQRAAQELEQHVKTTLKRLNVPSKTEVEDLKARIAELTRKLDELKQAS